MKNKIMEFVSGIQKSHRLAGVAVGIVKDGQSLLEAGFGVRDMQSGAPITPDSLFHLASISKLFAATAVMQLAEQGKLSLTDAPQKFLPYLKVHHPCSTDLTIQHLLSHTSGFPDVTDYGWHHPEEDDGALERYVRNLDVDLMFPPGERFAYSNVAYEVLGDLVAKVSGLSFEEYIKKNILEPLPMFTSTHFAQQIPADLKVLAHVGGLTLQVSDVYPYHRAHSPSSTLHSSVAEMNLWAIANLSGGPPVLQPATLEEMWQPKVSVGAADRPQKACGLGWFIDYREGVRLLYHSGRDIGFATYFLLVPEKSIGLSVLCNTAPAPVEEIAFGILDILQGKEPDPILPSVMTQLGNTYLERGLPALQAQYHTLKSSQPNAFDFGARGFLETAGALLDRNDNAPAIDLLSFSLQLFSENAAGHELLARAHFQSGDFEKAMLCAQRSLELNPDNPFLRQQLALLG
jgi:CubicO group peptidase (beta-lactamase class C family)